MLKIGNMQSILLTNIFILFTALIWINCTGDDSSTTVGCSSDINCSEGFQCDSTNMCSCSNLDNKDNYEDPCANLSDAGYSCNQASGLCICASDECCTIKVGEGFKYNSTVEKCVCKSDECCPDNFIYSSDIEKCICDASQDGSACCDDGYIYDAATGQCLCETDTVCNPNGNDLFKCGVNGFCLCTSDLACTGSERCNESGFCQGEAGCFDNSDCPNNQFCDSQNKICIDVGSCGTALHCPFGYVCDTVQNQCIRGCKETGDCPIGNICRDDQCKQGCDDHTDCRYGQICTNDQCIWDTRGPYCEECGTLQPCDGGAPNYCLSGDPYASPPTRDHCGVDCMGGQECPNGYLCSQVVALTDDRCQSQADCPAGSQCFIGEAGGSGFCSCQSDNDCPSDMCGLISNKCLFTGQPCSTDADCQIKCENGGCIIGANCGPIEGLSCEEIMGGG